MRQSFFYQFRFSTRETTLQRYGEVAQQYPSARITFREVAERLDEQGRCEGVKEVGGPRPQSFDPRRPVEDAGYAPLLVDRRERNWNTFQCRFRYFLEGRSTGKPDQMILLSTQPVSQILRNQIVTTYEVGKALVGRHGPFRNSCIADGRATGQKNGSRRHQPGAALPQSRLGDRFFRPRYGKIAQSGHIRRRGPRDIAAKIRLVVPARSAAAYDGADVPKRYDSHPTPPAPRRVRSSGRDPGRGSGRTLPEAARRSP